MKVYYLGNMYDGCYYVRCYLPMLHNGWNGERLSMYHQKKDYVTMSKEVLNSDVVVFQRPNDLRRLEMVKLLQSQGKTTVFDNDDTYKDVLGILKNTEQKALDEINFYIDEIVKASDLVTTTTEHLADEYRLLNKNVVVLPNCVDPDDWDEPKRNEGDKVRIGIVGSTTSTEDFDLLKDTFDWLNTRSDVQLVMFGLPGNNGIPSIKERYKKEYDFWFKYNIEWQPFVHLTDYTETLNNLKLDLMLIPRKDSHFNRCKSNIKFLEAAMCEIPVIAQGFSDGLSPYQKDIDGTNGIIAYDDWRTPIETLIKDKELRREMGKKARQYTLDNFDITKNHKNWEYAYSKCRKQKIS